jgi:hypothetical protein
MALESPVQRDGDAGFIGYSSRLNPAALTAGMLQESINMRLDRGYAQTRKGVKRLASDIVETGVPLVLDFILEPPPNEKIVYADANYTGGIFSSHIMLLPDETGVEVAVLAAPDRAYLYVTDSALGVSAAGASGVLAVSDTDNLVTDTNEELFVMVMPPSISYPSSPDEIIEPSDKVSMVQAYNRIYILREADQSRPAYSLRLTNSDGIAVIGTTATVNVSGHGFPAGARVRIEGGTAAAFDGQEYSVLASNLTNDSFDITVPSGTSSNAVAGLVVRRTKPPIYWDGNPQNSFVRAPAGVPAGLPATYKSMRSTPWASYINNRLIIPDGRQNVLISDVLDPDVYDPFWQSFRAGLGGNDFVVAVHPWIEGTFLVFCRKSIWLATVGQFPSTDGTAMAIDTSVSKLELLTDEIGCAARRTIATAGEYIYFLSDSGVYRLDSRLDLKLRGMTKPLSDPIADKFQTLNANLLYDAVGIYHDNRYYLAVPLANSSDTNDGVFLYNQLNEQWETQDVYGFGVNNFLVANVAGERRIMITNRAGFLMMLNQVEAGDENADPSVPTIASIPAKIVTRRYDFKDMHSKRFLRTIADVVIPAGASVTTKITTINPDTETTIGTLTNSTESQEDYNMKSPIRFKAHSAEVVYETSNGRPQIRSAQIEASPKSLPPTETRNAA